MHKSQTAQQIQEGNTPALQQPLTWPTRKVPDSANLGNEHDSGQLGPSLGAGHPTVLWQFPEQLSLVTDSRNPKGGIKPF